jgi:hypothetical protein
MAITSCEHRPSAVVLDLPADTSGLSPRPRPWRLRCRRAVVALACCFTVLLVRDPRLEVVERVLQDEAYSGAPDSLSRRLLHPVNGPPPPPPSRADASGDGPLVHQTVRNVSAIPTQQREWRASWQRLGFRLQTADDAAVRRDIERLATATGEPRYVETFEALQTSVQRSDMWRYAVLWLEGGTYADVDVVAHPPMRALAAAAASAAGGVVFTESLPLFDWMPPRVAAGVAHAARGLGLTDLVRLPQRRNCIMVARARHPLMLRTLQKIARKVEAGRASGAPPPPEPTRTLELTGPGIFTDALEELRAEGEPAALALRYVSRIDGRRYFRHVAQGSWKTYLGEGERMKPHERMVVRLVLLLQAAALAACLVHTYGARWRERLRGGATGAKRSKV